MIVENNNVGGDVGDLKRENNGVVVAELHETVRYYINKLYVIVPQLKGSYHVF